jgi:hypothetical protein
MRAPVSGGVTNLLVRQADYTVTGQTAMSIIDADGLGAANVHLIRMRHPKMCPPLGAGTSLQLKTNPL